MKVEVTKQMKEMSGASFLLYCTQEHPNKEFRSQCKLLSYAVMNDISKFRKYVDKIVDNPDKNLVAFYPAKDNKEVVKGKELVGTIIDGSLYFG